MRGVRAWLLLLAALLCWLRPATAHLMSADRATFNIRDDAAYIVLSLPVQFFEGVPLDGNGMVTAQGLAPYRQQIEAQVINAFVLTHDSDTAKAQPIAAEMVHITPSVAAHAPLADQVLVFLRFAWPTASHIPKGLHLHTQLWQRAAPSQLEIDVMQDGGGRDKYWLNTSNTDIDLQPTLWGVAWRFVRLGITHIVEGTDHLLFLFLLLMAQVSWRRWLIVLSGFTLAHACTYAAVMRGLVVAPTAWVETLIAATIAWSAGAILMRHRTSVGLDLGLTCVFGLIHGAGFASAVGAEGQSVRHPVLSLLGFNTGIELGQIGLALLLGLALQARPLLVRYGWQTRQDAWLKTSLAALSLGVALVWLGQRWGQ